MRQSHIAAAGVASDTPLEGVEAPAAVEKALQTLSNGAMGYRTLAEEVESPVLRSLLTQLAEERKRTVEDTLRQATDAGIDFEPETDGTIVGAFHRVWLKIESAVAGDAALVESAENAESHAIEQLEEALGAATPEGFDKALRSAIFDVSRAKEQLVEWRVHQGE